AGARAPLDPDRIDDARGAPGRARRRPADPGVPGERRLPPAARGGGEERKPARRDPLRGHRPPTAARVRARRERGATRGGFRGPDQGDVRCPRGRRLMPGQRFDMNQLLRQAQQMQAQMEQAQEELAKEVVEASAGGGLVTVKATGAGEIKEIHIDPKAIDPDDPELLEDTVLAAVNEALRSAQALAQSKLGGSLGSLRLPGL